MAHRERLDVARGLEGGVEARVDRGAADGLVVLAHDGQLVGDERLVLRQRDVLVRQRARLRAPLRLGRRREVRGDGGEPRNLVRVHPPVAADLGVCRVAVAVDRVDVEERGVCVVAAGP